MRDALLFVAIASVILLACVGDNPDTNPTTTSSSGGGPSARVVQCNDKPCPVGNVCCLTIGPTFVDKAECTAPGACPTGEALVCDNTADCEPGQKCCIETNGGSVAYGPSYCAKECAAGSSDVQLCKDSSECASKSCVPPQSSVTPTGLMKCE
jgi:hypothetical protein